MNARQIVESLLDEKPVIERDRVIKGGDVICPHCGEQIHEKGYGERDGKTIHRKCGGVIKMPEPSQENIEYLLKGWHLDYRDGKFVPLNGRVPAASVAESGPNIRVLKERRRELDPDERRAVVAAGGTWPDGRPGIWKAEINGTTWYVSNTHRVYQADKDLKTAIRKFKEITEPSS